MSLWVSIRTRIWAILVAFDKFSNVVLGGDQDQTISSRAAIANQDGKKWGCILCKFLNWLQPNHCPGAVQSDLADAEKVEKDEGGK